MAFGYAFVTLDDEQKRARRVSLEFYPMVAQLSVLVLFALFQIAFAVSWLARRGLEDERPRSPSFNKRLAGKWAWIRRSQQSFETLRWWLRKPLIRDWGSRGQWIVGGIWSAWLLYLCVIQTGNDYLHLTKRFGIIGASQLPLLYLITVRSPYSPIQLLTRMSHEELKASHQVLGRIVFLLFCLHTVFYLNFFILAGVFFKRVKNLDVICGIVSIILFSVISTTALARFRRWSYRVFYFWHVLLANLVILFLYTHVTHIRPYTNQVLGVIVFRSALRFLSTRKRSGTVKLVPGTDLVQVGIPLSEVDSALKWKPGQHVYLGLLSGKQHLWDMQTETNPFTVASIPGKDKELLLVARIMKGNTKLLAERARSHAATDSEGALQVSLLLEGPYGASVRLPDFSKFDRVLLVAGGVGATFTLPIYRSIVESTAFKESGTPKIRFVWALRKLAEIKWAFDEPETSETETASSLQNSLVEVFVTRRSGSDLQAGGSGEDIEMVENEQLLSTEEQMDKPPKGAVLQTGRPKLSAIVDQVFSQSSRVAVFTCGPKSMTEQLVHAVEHWVRKGHDVYWHEETFGW